MWFCLFHVCYMQQTQWSHWNRRNYYTGGHPHFFPPITWIWRWKTDCSTHNSPAKQEVRASFPSLMTIRYPGSKPSRIANFEATFSRWPTSCSWSSRIYQSRPTLDQHTYRSCVRFSHFLGTTRKWIGAHGFTSRKAQHYDSCKATTLTISSWNIISEGIFLSAIFSNKVGAGADARVRTVENDNRFKRWNDARTNIKEKCALLSEFQKSQLWGKNKNVIFSRITSRLSPNNVTSFCRWYDFLGRWS